LFGLHKRQFFRDIAASAAGSENPEAEFKVERPDRSTHIGKTPGIVETMSISVSHTRAILMLVELESRRDNARLTTSNSAMERVFRTTDRLGGWNINQRSSESGIIE
jgi:hypothetical protein